MVSFGTRSFVRYSKHITTQAYYNINGIFEFFTLLKLISIIL